MAKSPKTQMAESEHKRMVGQNLTLARESLGRGQAEFAREYSVSSNRLNQWEAGLYYPSPYLLTRICDDHGFTMDWFYRRQVGGVSYERAVYLRRAAEESSAA